MNVIDFCKKPGIPLTVMSIDAEKAFGRVETSYLELLMRKLFFGPCFLNALHALYEAPKAQLFVNNLRSGDFILTRGTRQGCPLSPLLFAIFLEPLAEAIRADPNIRGVQIGPHTHKLNLFADNMILFVTDPEHSFSALFNLIQEFGSVSGYSINQSKTKMYPVCISDSLHLHIAQKFTWIKKLPGLKNPGIIWEFGSLWI